MRQSNEDRQRFEELKGIRAIDGLSETELAELNQLARQLPDADPEDFDRVAAAIEQIWGGEPTESMPDPVRNKLEEQAANFVLANVASEKVHTPQVPEVSKGNSNAIPWLAAAASLRLAFFARYEPQSPTAKTVAEMRNELLTSASDIIRVDWTPTNASAVETTPGKSANGDVVWSPTLQKGFMRFRSLAVNDPTKEQYQLWIFDKNQSEATPIDGGVFDITESDAVVPIDAKLRVNDAYLFAVTIEKPGGVVVSSRERLPLLATVN